METSDGARTQSGRMFDIHVHPPTGQESRERDRLNKRLPLTPSLAADGQEAAARRTNEGDPGSAQCTPRSSWEGSWAKIPDVDPVDGFSLGEAHPQRSISSMQREQSPTNNPYRNMHSRKGKVPMHEGEKVTDDWDDQTEDKQPDLDSNPRTFSRTQPWMGSDSKPLPLQPDPGLHAINQQPLLDLSLDHKVDSEAQRIAEAHISDPQNLPVAQSQAVPFNGQEHAPSHGLINVSSSQSAADEKNGLANYFADTREGRIIPPYTGSPASWENFQDVKQSEGASATIGSAPVLPPRRSLDLVPPPQPPRPLNTSDIEYGITSGTPEPTALRQQDESVRKRRAGETYQIRLVNWYDAASPQNPRRSPVMVQNANGPCPLLALVNALVLSTPFGTETALLETLRVREQVSLGLLLDAVIDELMSGRRGTNLPDVSELYAFLVTLHTGMNVNPRFVRVENQVVNLMDAPIDGDLSSNLHQCRQAGGFEDTREMKLYSTFTIPLIHGWIPPRNHPAVSSLKRSAQTYEDAQNLMFREEELEGKLKSQGLTSEEQIMLEDIASVKYFLSSTATQLTGYGLDTMTETLAPGSIAILFRNDHFSTLYRHPRSGQLLTLVTDMGYARHDEVVWESLVDVSGEGCEFFSGDFRPVGNIAGDTQQPSMQPDEEGWTTVPRKDRKPQRQDSASQSSLPPISTLNISKEPTTSLSHNTEQEDHDLALAMQLQEEEEQQSREEAAKRRREDELSQAYLDNADSQGRRTFPGFGRGATAAHNGPSPPPRGTGSARRGPPIRPPERKFNEEQDAPPPSYEQAAKGPAYIPPAHTPAHPQANPDPNTSPQRSLPARPRGASAYSEHAATLGAATSSPTYGPGRRGHLSRVSTGGSRSGIDPRLVRRRSGQPGSAVSLEDEKKDKDCIVM